MSLLETIAAARAEAALHCNRCGLQPTAGVLCGPCVQRLVANEHRSRRRGSDDDYTNDELDRMDGHGWGVGRGGCEG